MTTMTLTSTGPLTTASTDAPRVRRRATRRRPAREPSSAVRGCAGEQTGARPVRSAGTAQPARIGVAPLRTAPSRLTRRGRVAVAFGFLAVLGGGLAVGQATVATTGAPVSYGVVTVEPGQTLWGIANQVAPGIDPRITVERLVEVNGLVDASAITAGDQLSVPIGG